MDYQAQSKETLIQKIADLEDEIHLLKAKADFFPFYHKFFTSADKGFAILDLSGKVIAANEAMAALVCVPLKDMHDQLLLKPLQSNYETKFQNAILPSVQKGFNWSGEAMTKKCDYTRIYGESYSGIQDDQGELRYIAAVVTDNTSQTESENDQKAYRIQLEELVRERTVELSLSHQKLEKELISQKSNLSLFEQAQKLVKIISVVAPVTIFKINKDGIITYWEGSNVSTLVGLRGSQVGRKAIDCFTNGPFSEMQINDSLQGKMVLEEYSYRSQKFMVVLAPLKDGDENVVFVAGVMINKYDNDRQNTRMAVVSNENQ